MAKFNSKQSGELWSVVPEKMTNKFFIGRCYQFNECLADLFDMALCYHKLSNTWQYL